MGTPASPAGPWATKLHGLQLVLQDPQQVKQVAADAIQPVHPSHQRIKVVLQLRKLLHHRRLQLLLLLRCLLLLLQIQQLLLELLDDGDEAVSDEAARMLSKLVG